MSRIDGQVALVTGAPRNIGAAIAQRLAVDGADVVVHHHREDSAGDAAAVVEAIGRCGRRGMVVTADLADPAQIEGMWQRALQHFGPVSLLVNNAATSVVANDPWADASAEDWDRVLRVNVTANFLCAKAMWQGLRGTRRPGAVVNISSQRALAGTCGNLPYATSKAAQLGFTKALAAELAPAGIRVNAVIVGAIQTPDERFYGPPDEVDRRILRGQLIPRRGVPDDVAAAVSFLCSDDAGFITGHELLVEGGALAI